MSEQCCCGPAAHEAIKYYSPIELGKVTTEAGRLSIISTAWILRDHIGQIKVRIGIDRMTYAITPGIYAVGNPGSESPVLVSANYKLSFDILRRELGGIDAWILVIDTKGVNVWCAAGKGTFGTEEIAQRVKTTNIEKIVSTRTLIIPQLGAPGVYAHKVLSLCGFSVVYGPVRAHDIKRYIDAGMKADTDMRSVRFGLIDRLTVSWLELSMAMKAGMIGTMILAGLIIATGVSELIVLREEAQLLLILLWASIISGTVLNAVLLPLLPGKAFSFKGGLLGAVISTLVIAVSGQNLQLTAWCAMILMGTAISAFLALNFTGASTFTSISGVKKEIRYSIPVITGMFFAGAVLEIINIVRSLL